VLVKIHTPTGRLFRQVLTIHMQTRQSTTKCFN
jgi:hypothetical protein